MFNSFWGSSQQQGQPQEMSADSWYPPTVTSTPSSSRPTTPGAKTFSNVSPSEAAGIIAVLKDKSVDELRKLLSDKDAYQNLLHSLEPVKTQNRVRDELRNETLLLAKQNLEKEPFMKELRNQCRIIRTTELATAQEKLFELERKREETMKYYSTATLLQRLQDAMNKSDEESETLHRQLLDKEIDLSTFVQKYKKIRHTYHKRALTHLAARSSATS